MSLPPLKWIASPNFNSRKGARVDQIIIHDMEGSYTGSIAYFQTRASDVSAHFCVKGDGSEITQMVHLADRAWHACNANFRSIGIEMEGYSKNGFSPALLATTAELTSWLCHHLQIPIRHARGGVGPGIESHWGLGVAGGHHFDPFPNANWIPNTFLPLVKAAFAKGDYDPNWDRAEDPTPCPLDHAHTSLAPVSAQVDPLDLSTVEGVQRALVSLGFNKLTIDGINGPQTEAAIKAFQTHAGLAADGIPGPVTIAALLTELSGG